MKLSQEQYSWLFSVYSMPNIVLPIFVGLAMNKVGANCVLLVTSFTSVIGCFILASGGYEKNFELLVLGRLLSGAAADNLFAVHAVLVAQWFADQELSLAYGVAFSAAMIAASVSGFIVPEYVEKHGMGDGIMLGCAVSVVSTVAAILLVLLNNYAKDQDADSERQELDQEDQMSVANLMQLDAAFWLMNIDNFLTYSVLLTQTAIGTPQLIQRFGFSPDASGKLIVLPYFVTIFAMPVIGRITDSYGNRQKIIILGGVLHVIGVIMQMTLPDCKTGCYIVVVPLFLFGIQYSIYMILQFGSLSYIVKPQQQGTAYGILTSLQDLGCSFLPYLLAMLHDNTLGW